MGTISSTAIRTIVPRLTRAEDSACIGRRLLLDGVLDIAGAMEHPQDLDRVLNLSVEDQVILKSANAPLTDTPKSRASKVSGDADPGHLGDLLERIFGSVQ